MVRRTAFAIGLVTAIVITVIAAFRSGDSVELSVRDAALRALAGHAAQSTVVIAIDETSIGEVGAWPWPRDVLAQIVNHAADSGARGVVIDLLLRDARPGDDRLAIAMRRVPSVAVSVLAENGVWLLPAPQLRAAATPAHGNFEFDGDGILRRFASTKQSHDLSLTAVPMQAASIITSRPPPGGRSVAPMFRTRPRRIPLVSAAELLRDPARVSNRLRDKIVFVGPTALGLGDRVLTPVSGRLSDPGVSVHAAATESVIRSEEVDEIPPIAAGLIGGIAVSIILQSRGTRRAALMLGAGVIAAMTIAGLVLLASSGIAIPFVLLTFAALIATAAVEAMRMSMALRTGGEAVVEPSGNRTVVRIPQTDGSTPKHTNN